MICPYCKNEIQTESPFCPRCGHSIHSAAHHEGADAYWNNVNREQTEVHNAYKSLVDETKRSIAHQKRKKRITAAVLVIVIAALSLGVFKYLQFNDQMVSQVRSKLLGKTMTATASHTEGLGFMYYEFWELTFTDDQNVRYAYIETAGPPEDDETPRYQGTYHYTISRSITGKYFIAFNGETFELIVNDDQEPKRISRRA